MTPARLRVFPAIARNLVSSFAQLHAPARTVTVGLAESPPHPEFASANSGLSPQAGRGEGHRASSKPASTEVRFAPRISER